MGEKAQINPATPNLSLVMDKWPTVKWMRWPKPTPAEHFGACSSLSLHITHNSDKHPMCIRINCTNPETGSSSSGGLCSLFLFLGCVTPYLFSWILSQIPASHGTLTWKRAEWWGICWTDSISKIRWVSIAPYSSFNKILKISGSTFKIEAEITNNSG